MTTYKDIRGTHITTVTSDPPAPVNGQMWYNSTTQVVKGFTSNPAGSWATGGALNTARNNLGGAGTQTAGLAFGGQPPNRALTEQYNGSSWTEVADLNEARNGSGSIGIQTAALAFGGEGTSPNPRNIVESWNGSSWTELSGDLNSTSKYRASAGAVYTAGLAISGIGPDNSSVFANVESWNGSAWTEISDVNTGRQLPGGSGTTTNALFFGGAPGSSPSVPNRDKTESWNGSSWTEVNDLNTARAGTGSPAGSPYSDTLYAGGEKDGYHNATELWNGTSWSEQNNLNLARGNLRGTGDTSSNLVFGGYASSSPQSATEEWTDPTTSTVTFTAS